MKKVTILCISLLYFGISLAQTITLQDVTVSTNLIDSRHGDVSLGDIDNDGDLDAFITGKDGSTNKTTLYTNDGLGNFTEVLGTSFPGYEFTRTGFADVDNDGDIDLLHTGRDNAPNAHSDLYLNDGTGNFILDASASIRPTIEGDFAFEDMDNDGDQDLLIMGITKVGSSFFAHTTLYLNDGTGGFSEVVSAAFEDVKFGVLAFGDLDADGDEDVIVAGSNDSGVKSTKLYNNDGAGNFSLVPGTPFTAFDEEGHIAIGDTDNDGDLDVLICGADASFTNISELYLNDGTGNFSLLAGTPFASTSLGKQDLADLDMDGDLDVITTGAIAGATFAGEVYENQGGNNFVLTTSIEPTYRIKTAIGDIDGDLDLDLFVVGITSISFQTRVYKNLYHNCPNGNIQALPKAFLQGALSGTASMNNTLGTSGLLPTTSPYADAKVANAHILDDMVDWVEIQIRDAATGMTVLESQSALLKANGDIVDRDGKSPLLFCQPPGNYRVAIKHRNHLGVMTAMPITFN